MPELGTNIFTMLRLIKDAFTEIYIFLMGLFGHVKLATYGSCIIIAFMQMLNVCSVILIIQHIVKAPLYNYFMTLRLAIIGLFIVLAVLDYLIIYPAEKTIEEESGPLAMRSVIIPYGTITVVGFLVCFIFYRH